MQIFLSHATADRMLVEQIRSSIGSLATIYCTEFDNQAGVNVHEKILQKIRDSDLLVVLLTVNGLQSSYVHQEIGAAKSAGKLVVPIVAGGTGPGELGMLEGIEYISLDPSASAEAISRLGERVLAIRAQGMREAEATREAMELLGVAIMIAGIVLLTRAAK